MKVTVDYHGFTQTISLRRLAPLIAVPGTTRLRAQGLSEFDELTGNEESLTIFGLRFALRRDRSRRRYECAGCSLCDPTALWNVLRRLAEAAASAAVRQWDTMERRERRIARTVERVLARKKAKRARR